MALIKKDADHFEVNIKKTVDDSRDDQKTTKYSAADRKSLRVDPPVFDTIKSLAYIKDVKMYELVESAVEAYKQNTLSDREREIFDSIYQRKQS